MRPTLLRAAAVLAILLMLLAAAAGGRDPAPGPAGSGGHGPGAPGLAGPGAAPTPALGPPAQRRPITETGLLGALAAAEPRTSSLLDADRNRILDRLDRAMSEAGPAERLPAIVVLTEPRPSGDLRRAAGDVWIDREYLSLPAFAVRATPAQLERLAGISWVLQIEADEPTAAQLDGARQWFGADRAVAEFRVDGDRDGAPRIYSARDVVICLLDSGIDTRHADLDEGKVLLWRDWIHGSTAPYDDHGHGTHVASIAAGSGDGDRRYRGVAPGAALVVHKVIGADGRGTTSTLMSGLDGCIGAMGTHGVRVVNMSVNGDLATDGTDALSRLVDRAVENGLVVVVSAGNDGPRRGTVKTPATARGAIAVGAMADLNERGFYLASFSSRGPTPDRRVKPDIVGPGVGIRAAQSGTRAGYVSYDGTSMAAPFVAGAVALMIDADPGLTPARVLQILRRTAFEHGEPNLDNHYGSGRIDAYDAVRLAGGFPGAPAVSLRHRSWRENRHSPTGAYVEYPFEVLSRGDPVAATLIMPNFDLGEYPNFDLYLYGPGRTLLGQSQGEEPHESVAVIAREPGTYLAVVYIRPDKGGLLQLDVSALTPPGPPPEVLIEYPGTNLSVSGRLTARIRAWDEEKVARVDLSTDGGANWREITGSFDGVRYLYDWDTRYQPDGWADVVARATDIDGVTWSVRHRVGIQNPRYYVRSMTSTVSPWAPTAWHELFVEQPGWVDLALDWDSLADLDVDVFAPDGSLAATAFSGARPERLRIDTERWGRGPYRIRISHYDGAAATYRLQARGVAAVRSFGGQSTWEIGHAGTGKARLMWAGNADLDFMVYAPDGSLRARGYSFRQPEEAWVEFDQPGPWRIEVLGAQGGVVPHTLTLYLPMPILM